MKGPRKQSGIWPTHFTPGIHIQSAQRLSRQPHCGALYLCVVCRRGATLFAAGLMPGGVIGDFREQVLLVW